MLYVYLVIFFILIGVLMFVHKVIYKGRMERQLGRKVQDRELTSFSAWMKTPESSVEQPEGRNEEKNKF